MRSHINEIVGREPIIDRHNNRAELRYRVELFEMLMRIGCDRGNPIPLAHAETSEGGAPSITSVPELGIRETQIPIDPGFAPAVQLARAAREFQGCQRRFHANQSLPD